MGHARALVGIKDDAKRNELAKATLVNEWSVRELEQAIQQIEVKGKPKTKSKTSKRDPYLEDTERSLREKFQTTVRIKMNKDKGKIELSFFNKGDLERLLDLLKM